MRVGELKDAMSDCLFQVEKYNKEKDEYEIICDPLTEIPKVIKEKKVITATPSIGLDKNGIERTVIKVEI